MAPESLGWIQLAILAFGFLVAGIVKGTTGLGYSTTALPLLTLAVGLHSAMPLVLVPSMATNAQAMATAGHFLETLARFWPLFLALLPGLAGGLFLLSSVDQDIAACALGGVVAVYAVFGFVQPHWQLSPRWERPLLAPIGLMTGFINGLTGSQIMPVVPFMLSLKLDSDRFVQAVNVSFTLSSLVMIAGLSHEGLMTKAVLLISILGLVPAAAGGWIGARLRRKLPQAWFRQSVLAVLLALGGVLISRGVVSHG